MKKNMTMMVAMLFTLISSAFADDKMFITDFEIKPAETKEVDILLTNPDAQYRDVQFDLYLPAGITWMQDEYEDFLCENTARCTSNHSNAVSSIEANHYRCVLNSMKKAPLSGNSGAILTITLKASDEIASGNYKGYFRQVMLSKADGTGPTYEEFSFDIIVKSENPSSLVKSGTCKQYFGGDAMWTFDEATKILTIRPHNGEEITQSAWDMLSNIKVYASDGSVNKLGSETNWTYTKGVQKSFETHTGTYENQQEYSYVDFVPTSGNITVGFNIPNTLSEKYDIYLVTCPIWLKYDYENIPIEEWDDRPYHFTATVYERENEGKNIGNFTTKGTKLENPYPIDGLPNTNFISNGLVYDKNGCLIVNDTTYLGQYEFKDTYDKDDYRVIIQIASSILSSQRINYSNEMLISSIILKPNSDTPFDFSIREDVEHVVVEDGITEIDYAFDAHGFHNLKTVSISNSVKSVCNGAFQNCRDLNSVTIPNSVTSVGDFVFRNCKGLTSVTLSNSIASINDYVFEGCSGLTSISIGSGVTSIGKSAFSGCSGLTSVIIPDGVTSIGESAFTECSDLTSAVIGSGVTSIGKSAFTGCSGLTSVIIPDGVTSIGESAFTECSGLTSAVIGSGVTSIGKSAFTNCNNLSSLIIGSGVTSIGNQAFYGCSNLTSIVVDENNLVYDSRDNSNAVINTANNSLVLGCANTSIPETVTSIGAGAFEGCSSLTSLTIPENITSVSNTAFKDCNNFTSLTVNCHQIGYWFYNLTSLRELIIGNNVRSINEGAFMGCKNLTSVVIPEGVHTIGRKAFEGCSSLTSVTIPNSLKEMGPDAFWYCNLTFPLYNATTFFFLDGAYQGDFVIPEGITKIANRAFNNCQGLTSVTIPESVREIEPVAFWGCSSLTSVTIPNKVKTIGYSTFEECSSLTSVSIPEGVTAIGDYAFEKCTSLTSVTIPNSVKTIGIEAFWGCSALTSATIGNSVEEIGDFAFSGCSALTTVTIPSSVTNIGLEVFWGCRSMTSMIVEGGNSIYDSREGCNAIIETSSNRLVAGCQKTIIPNSVTIIRKGAFGCSGLTSIVIPSSVMEIGSEAFMGCDEVSEVYCYSVSVPKTYANSTSIFNDINIQNITLYVPAASIDAYKSEEPWSGFGNIAALSEEPINVEDNYIDGVYYNFDVENQTAGVTSGTNKYIGEIVIPSSITYNGVPNYVTTIGAESFADCSDLTSIAIPESVTSIGGYAFMNCSSLSSVKIPESVTSIEAGAFNCSGLTSINIPYGVTAIGHNTFSCCYSLTSVTVPESVTSIDDYAFSWCNSLTSISIPSSITSLGEGVFYGCSGLTDVYCYAESVPETGAEMFNSVELGNATLHVSATSIDTYKETEPWKNFGNIVALPEIVPMEEDTEVTFDEIITAETDLTDVVIDNVYVTLDTEGDDGYDMEEKCIVLVSIVTDEQMETIADKEVKDEAVKENYNGLIFAVPAGKGIISITAKTKGNRAMSVKIGDAEAQTFVQPERGVVEVPYTSDKDTYVYVYGADASVSAKRRVSSVDSENSVLIYSVKWTAEESTGLDTVVLTHDDAFQIFTPDGKQIETLQKGVNIIKYKNGGTQKIHVK